MRKTIDFLSWGAVGLTILCLICTLSTAYNIRFIDFRFVNYKVLQWSIFFTMILWAVKLYDYKRNTKKNMQSFICLLFAIGIIFFIFVGGVW